MHVYTIWLVIGVIYFGCLFATALVSTVIYDLWAVRHGWRTVSREILMLGTTRIWLMLVISGWLGFAVGCLVGHLFLAQYVVQ